jgi:hypothetical protein
MPLLFLVIGTILLVVAIRGNYAAFFSQLSGDLPGFMVWGAAIIGIGMLGYVPKFQKPANLLLALVFIVLIIKNNGAYANFLAALKQAPPAQGGVPAYTTPVGPVPIQITGASTSAGSLAGKLIGGSDSGAGAGATDVLGGTATGTGFGGGVI